MKTLKIFVIIFLLASCAGPNPNPGERTVDYSWHLREYHKALEVLKRKSEEGYPWAQLRMGVAYQLGLGVKKDFGLALKWYKMVATQKAEGEWANGKLIAAIGKPGYFNQNGDAMVAQYQIATIYLKDKNQYQDLVKAYLWINYVLKESNEQPVFYCCEFAGGQWILPSMMKDTLLNINRKMTQKQRNIAEGLRKTWTPKDDL